MQLSGNREGLGEQTKGALFLAEHALSDCVRGERDWSLTTSSCSISLRTAVVEVSGS